MCVCVCVCVCVSELSSTFMEKMQSRDLLLGLHLPELDDLGQFLGSLPTSALLGLGALTAVLAYWISTRPRSITPPCDLRLQSQEVQVNLGSADQSRPIKRWLKDDFRSFKIRCKLLYFVLSTNSVWMKNQVLVDSMHVILDLEKFI